MESQKELVEEFRDEVADEEQDEGNSLPSGSESLDSEEDEDVYLAEDDGTEYKLDMMSPDSIKKASHNKEMILVCRRVSFNS